MNPYEYLRPVNNETFVGRKEIADRICMQTSRLGGHVYAILSGRRCGKTSLLNVIRDSLKQSSPAHPVIPITIDIEQGFVKPEQIYAYILSRVRESALSIWPDLAKLILTHNTLETSFSEMVNGIQQVIGAMNFRSTTTIVLLVDEIDLVLSQPWHVLLFDQLRALLSSSDIQNHISLILFGANYFYEAKEQGGSPLLNIATPEFLYNLGQSDINELIDVGGNCSTDVANQIWAYSGGQPHIAQYILHHIWHIDGMQNASVVDIRKAVNRYYRDHPIILKNWASAIGRDGCILYDLLTRFEGWADEMLLAKKARLSVHTAKIALSKLCFQGLAVVNEDTFTDYMIQGDLFRQWFVQNRRDLLNVKETTGQYLDTNQDNKYQITHLEIVQNKLEANKINGNISQKTGLSASEVKRLFKPIYDQIKKRPETSNSEKEAITASVKEIEQGLTKTTTQPKFLQTRFENLQKMAPDILEVILATITSPTSGFVAAAKKIAEKVKTNSGAK